jgi:hypothetical protein
MGERKAFDTRQTITRRNVMALFYVSASKPKDDVPFWTSSVIAQDMEESYRIGKERFQTENPDLNVEDFTLVATGETAEKSITT